ncbi:SDR family NAD(P)-dependent oxidoreductase [Lactobacillus sp. ESL0791]|uniref:elongation factor P 5-aminopentanone reductase n=1 Tax=Lactobacillus sp. ESL0791 TaxID=2983234 RepID=UPI0023F71579|nr:SDR family NAD(P)-dependent oxidoreductase [Lactobacillus sp. ESL0791]MDF7638562.1 SDR family NAD(P)-dependent oxidoreductase [Lactobacillus sp. ESL0791]
MKRAIVFGATGGIGRAICSDLAADGWSLYLHCNQKWDEAVKMGRELMCSYPQQDFIPVKLDFAVSDTDLLAFTKNLLTINAAVFAQGITDYNFIADQKMAVIEQIIQTNLLVPIKLTHLLESVLVKNDFSRIVYLGSVYGGEGSALEAVYSASKAGLTRFSQAYAREVASTNLTVNVVAPGAVKTPMNEIFSSETMQEVKEEIPAGRLAETTDISFWVKTILSPSSGYLTGQTIYVSGGWLL